LPTVSSSNCHEFTSVDTPALDAPHDTHFGSKRRKTYRGIRGRQRMVPVPPQLQCQGTCRALFSKAEGATEPTAGNHPTIDSSSRVHPPIVIHPWLADSLASQSRRASAVRPRADPPVLPVPVPGAGRPFLRSRAAALCRPRLRTQITSVRHELKSCLCASVVSPSSERAADLPVTVLTDELARLDVVVSAGRWFAPDAGTG